MTDQQPSLQRHLLLGIGLCVFAFVSLHAVLVYRQTLEVVNIAYDRTLLASAKTIGESLELVGEGASARVVATVPYSALEAFEADSRSRMSYRVTGLAGELVSGYEGMPPPPVVLDQNNPYAALVSFHDGEFDGRAVRVATLLQPVANAGARGMATIQVAETLELRQALTWPVLMKTLVQYVALLAAIGLVVWWVVRRATRGVRRLSAQIEARTAQDVSPIDVSATPRELLPVLTATNRVMARLQDLGSEQRRFVRDASHQLRTPLAVLKMQVQSALRGDVTPVQGLHEINLSIDRATNVANQMLALAKVEQLRLAAQSGDVPVQKLNDIVRDIALELAPLMVAKSLEFDIETQDADVAAHDWMLRELCRNLLANAIRFSPESGALRVSLVSDPRHAVLSIADSGPGLNSAVLARLFQPFVSASNNDVDNQSEHAGAGLGLLICKDICDALGGQIELDSLSPHGVLARVQLNVAARNRDVATLNIATNPMNPVTKGRKEQKNT